MATNPLWRKSLSEWKHQTLRWFQKRSMFQVPLSDVFFDFDTAYGVLSFGRELRDHIMRFVQRERVLFHAMLQTEADRRVALGLLGRLHSERTQEGILKINLKHGGILPLAGAVRLLALKEGLKATSTHKRIGLLHEAGVFSDDEADEYLAALEHLATILLRQQLRDFKRFQKATPYVRKSEISRRENTFFECRSRLFVLFRIGCAWNSQPRFFENGRCIAHHRAGTLNRSNTRPKRQA